MVPSKTSFFFIIYTQSVFSLVFLINRASSLVPLVFCVSVEFEFSESNVTKIEPKECDVKACVSIVCTSSSTHTNTRMLVHFFSSDTLSNFIRVSFLHVCSSFCLLAFSLLFFSFVCFPFYFHASFVDSKTVCLLLSLQFVRVFFSYGFSVWWLSIRVYSSTWLKATTWMKERKRRTRKIAYKKNMRAPFFCIVLLLVFRAWILCFFFFAVLFLFNFKQKQIEKKKKKKKETEKIHIHFKWKIVMWTTKEKRNSGYRRKFKQIECTKKENNNNKTDEEERMSKNEKVLAVCTRYYCGVISCFGALARQSHRRLKL